jgi:hypothetical protein
MFTKSRVSLVVIFFAGWFFSSITGGPRDVMAQTRITLASLNDAIMRIINGQDQVGDAAHADIADSAVTADSVAWAGIQGVPAELQDGDQGFTTVGAGLGSVQKTVFLDTGFTDGRYFRRTDSIPAPQISGQLDQENLPSSFTVSGGIQANSYLGTGIGPSFPNAPAGAIFFNTSTQKLNVYTGSTWVPLH